jgi:hypothetical protein
VTDYAQWQAANDRWLAGALADLRARLERAANPQAERALAMPAADAPAAPAADAAATAKPAWRTRLFGGARAAKGNAAVESPAPRPLAAAGHAEIVPAQATATPADTTAKDADGTIPALQLLAERFGLSPFERDLLMLCIGMELDTRFPALCAQAQHDAAKPHPTFALAFAVLDDPSWDVLSPERPLRYWRLLEIHQPGATPLIGAALMADERIVNFAKGLNHLDDRLAPLFAPLAGAALAPSQQQVADQVLNVLRQLATGEPVPPVQLLGGDGASKQAIAQAIAAGLGAQAYRLPAEMLPGAAEEQATLLRLWQRESRLLPLALYLDAMEAAPGDPVALRAAEMGPRLGGLTFIAAREPLAGAGAHALNVDVAKPSAGEQRAAWARALGPAADTQPQRLAGHFDFNVADIERIAQRALAATGEVPAALAQSLWQGALAHARPALDQLAQRVEPKAGWDDLELPASETALLHQIAAQAARRGTVYDDWGFRARTNRGLAISALFAGESGTGKTMAAEVLARELGLSLYRIDLSAVVSKYIGETEKNLRKLFDGAETGGAILFFDEADALFGKRSEVKDSHDRYANIEVNYLLQRLESFGGLAILATNLKGALDGAFLRRLRFVVNFPFPAADQRRAIWASAFPAQARVGALDLERLARFALTGGSIQGIALNAAFRAAEAGGDIGMPLLLDAIRTELRKLDKPVNESEFRTPHSAGGQP